MSQQLPSKYSAKALFVDESDQIPHLRDAQDLGLRPVLAFRGAEYKKITFFKQW